MNMTEALLKWVSDAINAGGRGAKTKVAQALGRNQSYVTGIVRGARKSITLDEVYAIAQALEIAPPRIDEHIDSGEIAIDGNLVGAANDDYPAERVLTSVKKYQPELPGGRPVVSVFGGLGGGGVHVEARVININDVAYAAEAVKGEIVLPPSVYSTLAHSDAKHMHWLSVVGDSMSGTLESGDWVGVDTSDRLIGQGGVFALRDKTTSEILVKRLRRVRGSDPVKIEIISDNPKQGNEIELAELIHVIGRVVARLGRVG